MHISLALEPWKNCQTSPQVLGNSCLAVRPHGRAPCGWTAVNHGLGTTRIRPRGTTHGVRLTVVKTRRYFSILFPYATHGRAPCGWIVANHGLGTTCILPKVSTHNQSTVRFDLVKKLAFCSEFCLKVYFFCFSV